MSGATRAWPEGRPGQMLKLLGVAGMSLLLLIPLAMVSGLVSERQHRRDEAIREITATWGTPQTVAGPVLVIPYRYSYQRERSEEVDGKVVRRTVTETAVDAAYFLPADLAIEAAAAPKKLHRGIYDAVVYSGTLAVAGRFAHPDWKALKVDEKDVLWDEAVLTLAVSDLRGAKGALSVELGGRSFPMLPGSRLPGYPSGAHAVVGAAARGQDLPFALSVDVNGSSELRFAPLGMRTRVKAASGWPDPKFLGSFLPAERRVSKDGFSASWDVSYYGRNYPQQATGRSGGAPEASLIAPSVFGVEFLNAVDAYRNIERATKYGLLFIAMAFAPFFLFEVRARLRIHPVQYLLVGLALVLFFLVLLSLSEFLAFGAAYLAGAAGATTMVALYSARFLGSGRRTASLAGLLAGVYGYLFVVLQLQDYALLMGTALLAAMLAALMYLTREVDWYALDLPEPPRP